MPSNQDLLAQLAVTRTIDLTTYGRRSKEARRIEIWWFHFEDRFVITGTPGRRDWLANVRANPSIIIHALGWDLTARAVEIGNADFRRRLFSGSETRWYRTQTELDRLVMHAPMIEVIFDP